jgi:hypothetical protein
MNHLSHYGQTSVNFNTKNAERILNCRRTGQTHFYLTNTYSKCIYMVRRAEGQYCRLGSCSGNTMLVTVTTNYVTVDRLYVTVDTFYVTVDTLYFTEYKVCDCGHNVCN